MKIKAKKGCTNPECVMCKKKVHTHKEDSFCPRCGSNLSFVCEKCHTVLENGDTKLCITCQAKKDDADERRKKAFGKAIGPVAVGVSAVVAVVVKKK